MKTERHNMPIPTSVILQGNVVRIDNFSGTAAESGKPFSITTATIIGNPTMGQAQLPDDLVALIKEGMTVTLLCEAGAYRGQDSMRAVRWLDQPTKG